MKIFLTSGRLLYAPDTRRHFSPVARPLQLDVSFAECAWYTPSIVGCSVAALMIWDRQCFRRQSLCPTFVEQLTHEMFVETFDREVVPPFVPVMAGGVPL